MTETNSPGRLTPEDKELIERAKAGDDAAFTKLIRKYETTVFNFAFKVCRNQAEAQETLQDTFISVYKKLKNFDGRSKFSTWLYTVIVRNCMLSRRKGKLEKAIVPVAEMRAGEGETASCEILPSDDASPLDRVVNSELQEQIDRAVRALPEEYRVVFVLGDIEGKTGKEIAKIMGLSLPAVKSRLRRARLFLRSQLSEYADLTSVRLPKLPRAAHNKVVEAVAHDTK